jgi:hypothetical protein
MTDPLVLDADGNPRSLDWLRDKYGPFVIYNAPPLRPGENPRTWRITTLREKRNAPATIVVKTLSRAERGDLQPQAGVKVAWYWPDADLDAAAGPVGAPFEGVTPNRAVHGYANGEGDTGFAMGDGAYYWPDRGERGPHALWIYGAETRSDLFLGLGMLPGTNHDHIDVEYMLMDDEEEPEPETEDDLLGLMRQVVEQLARIAAALGATPGALEDPANV